MENSNQNKSRKGLVWGIVGALVLIAAGYIAADYFFLHIIFNDRQKVVEKELAESEETYYTPTDESTPFIEITDSVEVIDEATVMDTPDPMPAEADITPAPVTEIKIVEDPQPAVEDPQPAAAAPAITPAQPAAAPAATPKEEGPMNIAMVEQRPQFPGGDAAMYKWISDNIKYPSTAQEDGVQGRVIVQFIIEKDGTISNVRVLRGKHPDLDKEARRVVMTMPKWSPGRNNGQVVRVHYNLPITFRLN